MLKELNARILRFLSADEASSQDGRSSETSTATVKTANSGPIPEVFSIKKTQKVSMPVTNVSISLDGKWAAYSFEHQVCIVDLTNYTITEIDMEIIEIMEAGECMYDLYFHTFTHDSNEIVVVWKPKNKDLSSKLSLIIDTGYFWVLEDTYEIRRSDFAKANHFQVNCLYPLAGKPKNWIIEVSTGHNSSGKEIKYLCLYKGEPRYITLEIIESCVLIKSDRFYQVGVDCLLIREDFGVSYKIIRGGQIMETYTRIVNTNLDCLIPFSLSGSDKYTACVFNENIMLQMADISFSSNYEIKFKLCGKILNCPNCKQVCLSPDACLLCVVQESSLVILNIAGWFDKQDVLHYVDWKDIKPLQCLDFADNKCKKLHWSQNSLVYEGDNSLEFIEELHLHVEQSSNPFPKPDMFAIRKKKKVIKPITNTSISLDSKWAVYSFEDQVCIMNLIEYNTSTIDMKSICTERSGESMYDMCFHIFTHDSNGIVVVWKHIGDNLTSKLSFIVHKEQTWALEDTCEIQRNDSAQTSHFFVNSLYPLAKLPENWIVETIKYNDAGIPVEELVLYVGDLKKFTIENIKIVIPTAFDKSYEVGEDCLLIRDSNGVSYVRIRDGSIEAQYKLMFEFRPNLIIPFALSSNGKYTLYVEDNIIRLFTTDTDPRSNKIIYRKYLGEIRKCPDFKKICLSPDGRLLCIVQESSLVILDIAIWVDDQHGIHVVDWEIVHKAQCLDFAKNNFKQLHWSQKVLVYEGVKSLEFIEQINVMQKHDEFRLFILKVYETMVSLDHDIPVDMILEVIKQGMTKFGYYEEHWEDVLNYIHAEHSTWFHN